ncbi:M12 family metallo-peptidase [Dyadobacter sp. CY312]|uniref:M12 family metallo-peptidase n=1 Tax=Dyadobacter sp. CY312 TaxID=2907303 RepID=UPI001F332D32|nr:M12 family metallo-peptidase [Dyadobacter sp. CY312]MCE7043508.1 M12 family metallo-peptidase [Dyadobacter sp. CY312]
MKTLCLLGILTLCAVTSIAQKRIDFRIPAVTSGFDLKGKFKQHELFKADVGNIYKQLNKSVEKRFKLTFSDKLSWEFDLEKNELLAPAYVEIVAGEGGEIKRKVSSARSYSGILKGGRGRISMTVDHGFFSAAITDGGQTWYVEQAQYLNGETDSDVVVVYNSSDVIPLEGAQCGVEDTESKVAEFKETKSSARVAADGCKVVELAIASDLSMFTKYGSASAAFNHNIAIMNNVAVLYRHEFSDNIEFRIVAQYIAEAPSAEPFLPLTDSTDPSTVLWNFTAWAEAGNFKVDYGIGQLWTNRDFNAAAVGIAWVRGVCTAGRYNALQDFGGNMAAMAVLAAHEIGHNFGADHDASRSATIMAPSVNMSINWSPVSKSDISNQISIRSCFKSCSPSVTPDFAISPSAACVGGSVLFKDKSTNSQARNWGFSSGSPSTSTVAQVPVTYALAGVYDVSLTADNTNTLHIPGRVIVNDVALNKESCVIPSGAGGTGGIKYFGLNEISFSSGNAATDGARYVDRSCSQIADLQKNTSYDFTINVGQAGAQEYVSIYIDYNGDGMFNESDERVIATDNTWAGHLIYNTAANSWLRFTTPFQITTNKILRLRIITDTTKPGSACHNPVNGQVEDYGVVFRGEMSNNSSLPVDLISFNGKSLESHNLLQWRTVNETGMKSYTVQRSEDGFQFFDIGAVSSQNTGRDQFLYEFKDDQITDETGGYYYKLQMAELDGKSTFSRIVYIKNNSFKSGLALVNCQTLINGNDISYDLVSNRSRLVTITVFDVMGNKVRTWDRQISDGKNHIKDDMSRLNSGIMFLSIKSEDQPVIVQKILR